MRAHQGTSPSASLALALLLTAAGALPASAQSVAVPRLLGQTPITKAATPDQRTSVAAGRTSGLEAAFPTFPEAEPNNAVADAQELPGPSPIIVNGAAESSDNGDLRVTYTINEEEVPDDLEDLFLVTTTEPGLRVTLDGFDGDLDLVLVDGAGQNILSSSAGSTASEEISDDALPAGTYLVAVNFYEAGGATGATDYRLQIEGVFGGLAEVEPNDTVAEAQRLGGESPIVLIGAAEASDVGDITYTFSDGEGGTVTDDMEDVFALTTTEPGLRVELGGFTEDLDVYILDPTNPASLTILGQSAGTSNPEVIDASNLPAGNYLVVVSFFDGTGETGETDYVLQVEGSFVGGGGTGETGENAAPTAAHEPPGDATAGRAYPVAATLTDDDGIESATLFYRRGSDLSFTEVAMTADGDTYTAEIPSEAVGQRGLAYFVRAEDAEGLTDQTETFSPAVLVGGDGLTTDVAVPTAEAGTYSLVTIPLDLDDADARAVLADDLGDYDPEVWRFYGLRPDQSYAEFPDAAAMDPGRGFWLALRSSAEIDSGPGATVSLAEPFRIPLNAGWNFVGSPFNFNVPLPNVRMASGQALDIWAYSGGWAILVGPLVPYAGYAVFAEAADELIVDPGLSIAKGGNATAKQALFRRAEAAWDVRVRAQAGRAVDADNRAAVHPDADAGRDRQDRPEPPTVGDYVSAYFVHPEGGGPTNAFSADVRGPIGERESWALAVRSNARGRIDLHFDLTSVPAGYDVYLEGDRPDVRQDLRARPHYAFVGTGEEAPVSFRLVVERAGLREATPDVPDRLAASAFPNPFSEATTVRFELPEPAPVTLTLHDALGRTVATLASETPYDPGTHHLVWDGRSQAGHPVASGVYLYRLRTGAQVKTGAVTLVRGF